jgi:hypothetical protein
VRPWENHFFLANLQWAKTRARARGGGGPAGGGTLTYRQSSPGPGAARHELCTWGEPIRPGVGSLSRKRHTQSVEQHRKGHCGNKSEDRKGTNNGGGAVCYGAEKF